MTTNLPAEKPKATQLVEFLDSQRKNFTDVLTVNPDRFWRLLKNSIIKDPQIAEASKQSVYLEIQKACADGLMLDGREAVLTRFKNRSGGVDVAYIPMVHGIMKRVRNSGEIKSWQCELVHEKEYETGRFKYVASPASLYHEPIIVGERGKVVAAYSAVQLKDGSFHYEVMTRDQMEGIRKRSKAQNGPWSTDTDEMYRKTVIRRHAKRLPVSSEALTVTQRVDALYDLDADHEVEPAPRRKTAADIVQEAMQTPPVEPEQGMYDTHDPETGEIIDGDVLGPDDDDSAFGAKDF